MFKEKRWRAKNKAECLDPNYPINANVLQQQEEAARKIDLISNELDNQAIIGGNGLHEHLCLFSMLSNDKSEQYAECRKWRKKHNNKLEFETIGWSDACDFCEMMCYVALDDEGKLMYVSRTFPDELRKEFENR